MVYFVGAGPGACDLITLRGRGLLERADVVVYAGSLVNPELLEWTKPGCRRYDSASMTLEQVMEVVIPAAREGREVVRLHTGDPSLYGAVGEQMDLLRREGLPFQVVPGVSSVSAAAAALEAEYTLPGISQTLICTRMPGRTPVPDREDLAGLASHGASLAVFLSAGMAEGLVERLLEGGVSPRCPAAAVYKASWPEERVLRTTVAELPKTLEREGIQNHALILVGGFLEERGERSLLYHPEFGHGFREAGQ